MVKVFQICFALLTCTASVLGVGTALAAGKSIQLELNNAHMVGKDCRVSFLVSNQMQVEIEQLSLEVVVFDDGGFADKFLLISTGRLLKGKSLVSQFDLAGKACAKVSRILVNNVTVCKGVDMSAGKCLEALQTSSRVKIKFGL